MNTAEARKACEGDDFTDETGTFTEKELEKRYWSFHGKNSALFQISFQRGAVVEVSGRTLVVGNDVFGPRAYVQSISEVLKEKPIKFFEGPNESDGIKSPVEHLVFVKVGVIIRNQSNIDQARYTLYDVKVFPRKTLQRSSEQP